MGEQNGPVLVAVGLLAILAILVATGIVGTTGAAQAVVENVGYQDDIVASHAVEARAIAKTYRNMVQAGEMPDDHEIMMRKVERVFQESTGKVLSTGQFMEFTVVARAFPYSVNELATARLAERLNKDPALSELAKIPRSTDKEHMKRALSLKDAFEISKEEVSSRGNKEGKIRERVVNRGYAHLAETLDAYKRSNLERKAKDVSFLLSMTGEEVPGSTLNENALRHPVVMVGINSVQAGVTETPEDLTRELVEAVRLQSSDLRAYGFLNKRPHELSLLDQGKYFATDFHSIDARFLKELAAEPTQEAADSKLALEKLRGPMMIREAASYVRKEIEGGTPVFPDTLFVLPFSAGAFDGDGKVMGLIGDKETEPLGGYKELAAAEATGRYAHITWATDVLNSFPATHKIAGTQTTPLAYRSQFVGLPGIGGPGGIVIGIHP